MQVIEMINTGGPSIGIRLDMRDWLRNRSTLHVHENTSAFSLLVEYSDDNVTYRDGIVITVGGTYEILAQCAWMRVQLISITGTNVTARLVH